MYKTARYLIAGALIALALSFAARLDAEYNKMQNVEYCKMTALYSQTGGEYGWPAYKKMDCR